MEYPKQQNFTGVQSAQSTWQIEIIPLSDRVSMFLQRIGAVNDRLDTVLGKLRGHRPLPINANKDGPQPSPNLDLMLMRLDNMLGETEGHVAELDRTI